MSRLLELLETRAVVNHPTFELIIQLGRSEQLESELPAVCSGSLLAEQAL